MKKKSQAVKKKVKRKYIRFVPDEGTLAYILTGADGEKLKVPTPCLVIEESYAGCSFVALKNSQFREGAELTVKVGKLNPMRAQIRWVKTYGGKVSHAGLVYQE